MPVGINSLALKFRQPIALKADLDDLATDVDLNALARTLEQLRLSIRSLSTQVTVNTSALALPVAELIVNIPATEVIPAFVSVTITGKRANSGTLAHYGYIIGISNAGAAIGFNIPVVVCGLIVNPAWTFNTGDNIFLNGTALSSISPATGFTQNLAKARGPTSLVIEPREPILL